MGIAGRLRFVALMSVAVMVLLAALVLHRAGEVSRELEANEVAVRLLDELGSLRYLTLEYLLYRESRVESQWRARHATINDRMARAASAHAGMRGSLRRLRETSARISALFDEIRQGLERSADSTDAQDAVAREQQRRRGGLMIVLITQMNAEVADLLKANRAGVASTMASVRSEVVVAGLVLAVVVASVMLFLTRRMVKTLGRMQDGARELGRGNLGHRLGIEGNDELGHLARAFDQMAEALQATTLSRDELVESSHIVVGAASGILTTVTQVSASTQDATAAVTRTAATVSQVRATAQVANDEAHAVLRGARKAEAVARVGRESVEKAHAGMRAVHEKMHDLAQSLLRLSERNQAIGEIVATAKDLAGQSKILAVNAAIEAADAGERGAGFAAVAHEIRTLATQSGHATGQVRALLREIHAATEAAVVAAEYGATAVEAGLGRVAEADNAIGVLAQELESAAASAERITASSQAQSELMDDVAEAMNSIMEASLQNASGIRQVEGAASELAILGQRLSAQAAACAA